MGYIPKSDAEFDEWVKHFARNFPNIATAVNLPSLFSVKICVICGLCF